MIVLRILTWPVTGIFTESGKSIRYGSAFITGREDRSIWNALRMLPLITIITGIAAAIFAYVRFIMAGGYTEAADRIRENGIFSFDNSIFVNGTHKLLYNKYLVIAIVSLFVIEVIAALVIMCKEEKRKAVKILSVVMMIMGTVVPAAAYGIALFVWNNAVQFTLPESTPEIVILASAAMITGSLVLAAMNPHSRELIARSILSTLAYFISLPVIVWLAENAVGVVGMIAGLIIAFVSVVFICGLFSSGGSSSSDGGSSSSSCGSSNNDRAIEKKKAEVDRLKRSNSEYAEYNRRQAAGDWGYQHFDSDKNRQVMADQERMIRNYEADIARLEKSR